MLENETGEFYSVLNKHAVAFLLVGGYAVNFYGYARATIDLDIWYDPSDKNFRNLLLAIEDYGFVIPTELKDGTGEKKLIRLPLDDDFKIELMPAIDGRFSFDEAHKESEVALFFDIPVRVISYKHLIDNKIISRRPKDLHDIEELTIRKKK